MWPFGSKPNQELEALRARFEALKPRMFEPIDTDVGESKGFVRTIVCGVMQHEGGRLGIIVARSTLGTFAVHEVNQDGTFSKRLPYWTRKGERSWRGFGRAEEGRHALVRLLIGREGTGFKMSNMDPKSIVPRIGLEILKMDTDQLPKWTWDDFRFMHGI